MSESFGLGVLLAIVGGYLDAYTYICRGRVFANAQTGNIVLLGVNFADGNYKGAMYYLIPIMAFTLGILLVECIKDKFKEYPKIHWRQITVLFEILVLFVVGFIPMGSMDLTANAAVSFVCAIQVESFRKLNGNTFATTMCTGNLRSAAELLYKYKQTKDIDTVKKSLKYYGVILFFILGAFIGAAVSDILSGKAVLVCCVILAVGFAVMFIEKN